jgi:hypothetical protein
LGIRLTAKNDFKQDLSIFVSLFVTRGTALDKMLKRMGTQASNFLARKLANYGITTKAPKTESKPGRSDITIQRLAACVPHWVRSMYKEEIAKPIFPIPYEASRAARTTAVAALLRNHMCDIYPLVAYHLAHQR